MPSKNTRKTYIGNSFYHIYNRGVEKKTIFNDETDYRVFLSYLKDYLLPKNIPYLMAELTKYQGSSTMRYKIKRLIRLNNFYQQIELLAYCLMPNHFHLLIKQSQPQVIDMFTNSLCTRYSMYFNRKYHRVGPLYEGVYKAVTVTNDEQLIYLSKYIHHQAINKTGQPHPSSYPTYLNQQQTPWVNITHVLTNFNQSIPQLSYQQFVEESEDTSQIAEIILEKE